MNIISVTTPSFCADGVSIICLVEFDNGEGVMQFVANPNDCMDYGRDIHARILLGEFGPIAEYVVPTPQVPQAITSLQGLLAINQFGLSVEYDTWANNPSRSFVERAFINKAQTWLRSDQTLISAATAIGITNTQLDEMFIIAATL